MPSYIHIAGNRINLNKKDLPQTMASWLKCSLLIKINILAARILGYYVSTNSSKSSDKRQKWTVASQLSLLIFFADKNIFKSIVDSKLGKILQISSSCNNCKKYFVQPKGVKNYG